MKKHLLLVVTIILSLSLFLSACSIFSLASAPTATPTSAPTPTKVITPTPTPVPTPSPTPTLSPEEIQAQREAEINQEIQAFLNAEGDYADEIIKFGIIRYFAEDEKPDLGLLQCNYNLVVQGCLLDYVEKEEYLYLIVGFKDKNLERFVTVLRIPLYYYEMSDRSHFEFIYSYYLTGLRNERDEHDCGDKDAILDYLSKIKGHSCVFYLPAYKMSTNKLKESPDIEMIKRHLNELNESVELSEALLYTVYDNGYTPGDKGRSFWNQAEKEKNLITGFTEIDIDSLGANITPVIFGVIIYTKTG